MSGTLNVVRHFICKIMAFTLLSKPIEISRRAIINEYVIIKSAGNFKTNNMLEL